MCHRRIRLFQWASLRTRATHVMPFLVNTIVTSSRSDTKMELISRIVKMSSIAGSLRILSARNYRKLSLLKLDQIWAKNLLLSWKLLRINLCQELFPSLTLCSLMSLEALLRPLKSILLTKIWAYPWRKLKSRRKLKYCFLDTSITQGSNAWSSYLTSQLILSSFP